jgi:cytolysin (calcineurin-like family phosphatase)
MYTLSDVTAPAGTTPEYPFLASLGPLVQSIAAAYGVVKQSDLNAELIRQGKAPMTAEQMRAFDPRIQLDVGADTRNIILYALGGIGGLFLLMTLMKSR